MKPINIFFISIILIWISNTSIAEVASNIVSTDINNDNIEYIDGIKAIVNDRIILYSEFQKKLKIIESKFANSKQNIPDLNSKVLSDLILYELQLDLAEKSGFKVSDEEINTTLAVIASNNNINLEELVDMFSTGEYKQHAELAIFTSYNQFREEITKQMLIEKFQRFSLMQQIVITKKEVNDFINRQEGKTQYVYDLSHIFLSIDDNSVTDSRQKKLQLAQQIVDEFIAGEDFANLAIKYSNNSYAIKGGSLGLLKTEQIPDLFLQTVISLKPKQISKPIVASHGIYLLLVNSKVNANKKEQEQFTNDEQKENAAYNALYSQKAKYIYESWLQSLRASAYIVIF